MLYGLVILWYAFRSIAGGHEIHIVTALQYTFDIVVTVEPPLRSTGTGGTGSTDSDTESECGRADTERADPAYRSECSRAGTGHADTAAYRPECSRAGTGHPDTAAGGTDTGSTDAVNARR